MNTKLIEKEERELLWDWAEIPVILLCNIECWLQRIYSYACQKVGLCQQFPLAYDTLA